jgi:SAM-dependent methyltransferase
MTDNINCCPVCEGKIYKHNKIFSEMLNLLSNHTSKVFTCKKCKINYLWPYISREQLDVLYGKSYFTGNMEGEDTLEAPTSNSDYQTEIVNTRVSKFKDTVDFLLAEHENAKSILDIGAATGEFLAICRKKGLSISGIELSSYACRKANANFGFKFHQTSFDEYQGKEKYDLIHMSHVFEHLQFPNKAMDKISSLLNPNGLIYIEVPFQFNFVEKIKFKLFRRNKVFDVFSLHHPIFYTPSTLKKVLKVHDFDCIKLKVFKWSRYSVKSKIGKLKRMIWFFLSLFKSGTYIEAIFRKR